MKQYHQLIHQILKNGHESEDRTGVGTKYLFGRAMKLDLQKGFPLLTTRKMYFKGIKDELLWMLSGSTNINDLPERTRQIWDHEEWWVDDEGNLGPSYGKQFRDIVKSEKKKIMSREDRYKLDAFGDVPFPISSNEFIQTSHFDQLKWVIDNIQENPNSRRHVLSLWQQPDMSEIPLPCCHSTALQFRVRDMKYLDCCMYARSQDVAIGMPWNIGFYALLTHMIAQVTGFYPGKYTHMAGDCHIYKNHLEKITKLLSRGHYKAPELELNPEIENIDHFGADDIQLKNYQHHPEIDFPIAV